MQRGERNDSSIFVCLKGMDKTRFPSVFLEGEDLMKIDLTNNHKGNNGCKANGEREFA